MPEQMSILQLGFSVSSFLRHSSFACRAVALRRRVLHHSSLCWRLNMKETIKRLEDGVGQKGVQEQLHIKHNDNAGCRPAENFQPKPVGKLAHFRLFTRKPHQRPDGEAELHAQDDLAGYE